MVTAKHVTYGGSRLSEGLIIGQSVLVHRIENTAVYRLHTVTDVGKSSSYDNAHRVVDITALYLFLNSRIMYYLFFVITVIVFVCHIFIAPLSNKIQEFYSVFCDVRSFASTSCATFGLVRGCEHHRCFYFINAKGVAECFRMENLYRRARADFETEWRFNPTGCTTVLPEGKIVIEKPIF
jgi:hypothetical protein